MLQCTDEKKKQLLKYVKHVTNQFVGSSRAEKMREKCNMINTNFLNFIISYFIFRVLCIFSRLKIQTLITTSTKEVTTEVRSQNSFPFRKNYILNFFLKKTLDKGIL